MTTIFAPLLEITPEEFKRATEVTYLGQVYGTMAALKRMRSRDRGCMASQKRREVYVAWPTVKAIYGEEMVSSFADQYLAKHAYDGQQTSEPGSPNRPDNLFEPVHGEYSAHGIFDDRAKSFSVQSLMNLNLINLTAHRRIVALTGMALTGLLVAAFRKWS
jgi:NAD(P)-dependent dehydrogenase (short-subunit alcohol dehydrogenase family)